MKKKFVYALFFLFPAMLMADPEEVTSTQSMAQTFVMIGIAALFFYVILWRPEQKRRKVLEAQRSNLKKGDRVTAMGIIGTVDEIKEHSIVLRNIDGSKIEILSAAISDVSEPEEINGIKKES